MSDTNPLPAAQLLKLADAMANAIGSHIICDAGLEGPHMERTWEAYRAARAKSPVTLEEAAIPAWAKPELAKKLIEAATIWADEHAISPNVPSINEQDWRSRVLDLSYRLRAMKYEHEQHARRLAGEGGA